jgi:formylglycine-generating enzyme required for sulfatase activity
MGNNDSRQTYETPAHHVTVGTFWIGRNEVTFNEYDEFCQATGRELPPDRGWGRGTRPAIHVTWADAVAYCNWRSTQEGLRPAYRISGNTVEWDRTANGYRLPTEAEWEFAARGGTQSRNFTYIGGNDPYPVGNLFPQNANAARSAGTQAVGQRTPNELGLKDMGGNVWEWCWDWYSPTYYRRAPRLNPTGPESGRQRVVRGGSWYSHPEWAQPWRRSAEDTDHRSSTVGFRLARNG